MPDSSCFSRPLLIGLATLVLGATAFAVWYIMQAGPATVPTDSESPRPDPPAPDPRLVFETPFRNVKPDVRYVGDAACAACHHAICDSYHAHPMGRSAEFVTGKPSLEKFDPTKHHTSFSSGNFELRVERTPDGMRHHARVQGPTPVSVPEFTLPAEIAIGSGTRGRSYLMVDRGSVWQTAVSWYGPEERWDISPGFRLGKTAREPITAACLYCHVDRVEPISGTINRYREPLFPNQAAIGCERCHGPGELHVAERKNDVALPALDTSIVNPRHLAPSLQAAICEQCHLQGAERVTRRGRDPFEFRPGLPFEQFVSVYVRHPDITDLNMSVGQFEQMERSRCFTGSGGKLGCTSCHDPHTAPKGAALDLHYRNRCLTCHDTKGCTETPANRQAKADSCIACHMPRSASSSIIHASVTNHLIPRKPAAPSPPRGLEFGTVPLVRFRNGPLSPPRAEQERDLGIALARFGMTPQAKEVADRGAVRFLAVTRLRSSLEIGTGDAEAWHTLATAMIQREELDKRFQAATMAAALVPDSEQYLIGLVEAATAAGKYDLAIETAGKLISMNPRSETPLLVRSFAYLSQGEWARAEADSRAALRLQPLHPEARLYLAICRYRQGDRQGGEREMETAAMLESGLREQEHLREWFRRATR